MASEELFKKFSSIVSLSPVLVSFLENHIQQKNIKKGEHLLQMDETNRFIYFVGEGLLKSYYTSDGKEITNWFMKAGDVVISVHSFYFQKPSFEAIQALENSTLFSLSHQDLMFAYQNFPEFNVVGRVLTEHYYRLCEERIFLIRCKKSHDRYLALINSHPEIIHRAPVKDIASYLGITIETLSRIRARLSHHHADEKDKPKH